MALFNFGGSKQSSSSVGSSSSLDFSRSGGESGGESVGGSQSQQTIAFEDIFARLFGGAADAAGGLDPSLLSEQANQLFSGGLEFLDSLSGGPGTDFLQSRVSGESPVLGEQISALGEDIGKFFNEQILPGISSEAVGGGTLGGGRQGVAEGIAGEGALREFQRGSTMLRAEDIRARDAAAATLGEQRIAGASAGLGGLNILGGIAEFGFGAELAPFERLAAILGGPTVLGESSSFSNAENFAEQFSSSFGTSQSDTRSRSSGVAADIGFLGA
jgi:hypothetical protein